MVTARLYLLKRMSPSADYWAMPEELCLKLCISEVQRSVHLASPGMCAEMFPDTQGSRDREEGTDPRV